MWPNDLLKEPLNLQLKRKYQPKPAKQSKEVCKPAAGQPATGQPATGQAAAAIQDVTIEPPLVVPQSIYDLIKVKDYAQASKEIAREFFKPTSAYRPKLQAEIKFILERTDGVVVPLPVGKRLPILLRHYHNKGSINSKVFFYLLWYMDDVTKHGGRFCVVQCLNGPYQGEHFSRLDEAMRVNVIWAWATMADQFRPNNQPLGQNQKVENCALDKNGVWRKLNQFKFENLPESICSVRNEGFSFRADYHPYPVFLPPNCSGRSDEFVDNLWSQQHLSWKAVSSTGDTPCVCPQPCYHPPMDNLSSREHIVPLRSDPNNPFSKCVPHCRALRKEYYWIEHLSDNPFDNWHNAIAYTVAKAYNY